MNINIRELKEIMNSVLEKCILNNGEIIQTEEDNFWYIDLDDGTNFVQEPDNLCVGSLNDDYKSLEVLLKNERNINILDLDRIANVIKFISLEIGRSTDKHL